MHTVDDLLDFIESRTDHRIDWSDCDCHICNMCAYIVHFQNLMTQEA